MDVVEMIMLCFLFVVMGLRLVIFVEVIDRYLNDLIRLMEIIFLNRFIGCGLLWDVVLVIGVIFV